MMRVLAVSFACALLTVSAPAQEDRSLGPSGLPLPRFVSLGTDEANMRTGPNEDYPILWRYVRAGIPLEITAEYGNWRRVRDSDGAHGWMHSALLSGRRTALVTGGLRPLRRRPAPDARITMRAEPDVLVKLERCDGAWCKVALAAGEAWIRRDFLWGTYDGEKVD